MARKCIWCNAKDLELTSVELESRSGKTEEVLACSSDCEEQVVAFNRYAESHVVHFLLGLLVLPLTGLIPIAFGYEGVGLLMVCGFLGAVMIKYPFCTPQTVAWLGAKRSIAVARWFGAILVIAGIVLLFVAPNGG